MVLFPDVSQAPRRVSGTEWVLGDGHSWGGGAFQALPMGTLHCSHLVSKGAPHPVPSSPGIPEAFGMPLSLE